MSANQEACTRISLYRKKLQICKVDVAALVRACTNGNTETSSECPEFKYGMEECNQTCNCVRENTVSCNSTNGVCKCKPGWGSTDCSQDVDECSNQTVETCPRDYEECVNTIGSFRCQCKEGLIKAANGNCEVSPAARCQGGNRCSHLCVQFSVQGQAPQEQCYCPDNMKLVGNTCESCSNVTFGKDCRLSCKCVANNTKSCEVTTGGCVCAQGWTSSNCSKDIDECTELLDDVCPAGKHCINKPGGYDCNTCGGTVTNSSGLLQSPHYPQSIPEQMNCSWTVVAPEPGATVSFRVSSLYINYYDIYREDCYRAALEVYDGSSSSDVLLGRYCGYYSNTGIIMSSGPTMYLVFHAEPGAFYTKYFSGAYSVNGYKVYRHNLTSSSGNITSPGYANSFSHNVYSTWIITVASGYVVTLNFSDYGLGECGKDYVEVYDGKHAGANLISSQFCKNNNPRRISSTENSMYIIYSSLGNTTEKGFTGSYVQDACKCYSYGTQSCISPTGPCVCKSGFRGNDCSTDINECLDTPCPAHSTCYNTHGSFDCICWNGTKVDSAGTCYDWSKILTDEQGYFQSQGFPIRYPYRVNYTWTIIGKPNTVVSLRFSQFHVDAVSKCYWDVVKVYDTSETNSRLIGEYCGKNAPNLLRTRGRKMNITFITDGSYYDYNTPGFNCTYSSHECPEFRYGDQKCDHLCSCAYATTQVCDNTNGVCFCKPGWVGRGCSQDLDECRNPTICPVNSDCVNQRGTYECVCRSGYVKDNTGHCKESSSCSEAMRKKCSHLCDVNPTTRKETCVCPTDMDLSSNGVTCIASLYPYGSQASDKVIDSKTKDTINDIPVSKPIQFSSDVPVGKSLHSTAYVLNNGVIIFNNNGLISTPNLKAAHLGSQNILAPLWTEKGSYGVGAVYYHLYENCDIPANFGPEPGSPKKSEVLARASRDIKKYHKLTDFKVTSVLVATWEAVPPKGCETSNTFQAVFVTGYVPGTDLTYFTVEEKSYSVFIYKNGEGVCQSGQPFQIGISTDNGVTSASVPLDTKTANLTNVKGNTGEIGVLMFPTGSTLSASQMCQRYLCKHSDLVANEHFQTEIDELYKCPCTLDRLGLQWQLVKEDAKTRCYAISAVAKRRLLQYNQRNRLCCYSWTPPKSNDWKDWFQSWQAGSFINSGHLLISDPWQFSNSFGNTRAYEDATENMQARTWCCGKSSYKFCERFNTVFGDFQCTPYPTFVPASALGDPTVVTLDGFSYPMNGWGEYILMDIQSEHFTLQARTQRIDINGQASNGTVFSAFAAREQDYAQFQVQLDNTNTAMVILVDGMDFTSKFYSKTDFTWSTNFISIVRINERGKIIVAATFPCGVSIRVHVAISCLEIELEVDVLMRSKTLGLLGNFNGDPNDEFTLPNGTVLTSNMTERQILQNFAKQYLVTQSTSAFIYNQGESTNDYQHPEFVPKFMDEAEPGRLAEAKTFCGDDNRACVYDYMATGNANFAKNSKEGKEATDWKVQSFKNTPPTIQLVDSNSTQWLVYEGKQNSLRVSAHDVDGDHVIYELTEAEAREVVLYQNGTIFYTPDLQAPVSLGIRAKDSKGAYSAILTIVIAVCPVCNNHGTCNSSDTQAEFLEGHYQILRCNCDPAYTGDTCESELNGCALSPCLEGQNCTDLTAAEQGNSPVGYRCGPCPPGTTEVNGTCEDTNECLDSRSCEQECLNTYRSFSCYCRPGYRLDQTNHQTCNDVNECEDRTSGCQQECTNTQGNYTCSCKQGYTLASDGKTCIIGANISSVCQKCQQVCLVNKGQVSCDCNIGYNISTSDPTRCVDIDECNNGGSSPCSQKCSNLVGRFECSCHPGYRLGIDRVTCVECESPYFGDSCSSTCDCRGQGTCDKVLGCVCDPHWSGINCDQDVDECVDSDACAAGLVCVNEPGSFRCVCPEGYHMANGTCSDIDECATSKNLCNLNVEDCFNNLGNYSCRCKEGYTRNVVTGVCQDINECESQTDGCEHICENGPGSYRCVCHQGYMLAEDRHKCEKYKAVCNLTCSHGCSLNSDGTPFCICPRGYQRIGTNVCQDIDECQSPASNQCDHADRCTNTEGDYTCSCEPGYRLENDGRQCTACSGGTWGVQCNRSCSCGKGAMSCHPVTGCVCKPGYTGEHCIDIIDRCANGELKCQTNEECVLAGGNSVCQCRKGYVWTGGQCQDENECLNRRLHNCEQICTNTQGGYTCSCYSGYTYNSSANTCTDVDECQQRHPCSQTCTNTDGSYRCSCQPGQYLQADGVSCGSCITGCPSTCKCVENNTDQCDRATGQCTCKAGWTGDDCSLDVDECSQNPCPEYRQCQNLNGSFECVCWGGLQISSNGTCKDCNRTMTERTGYLMSSNYPQLYDSNTYCSWTITASEAEALITLRVQDYDVEGCPYDYLEIHDGSNKQAPLIMQYCSSWQKPVTSTGNSMYVLFQSDSSISKRGFLASFVSVLPCKFKTCSHTCSVVSSKPWTETCQCPEWMKLASDGLTCVDINACNAIITEPTGYIVSKNYPEMYPLNFDCHWTIQGKQNSIISLSFSDFSIEDSEDCDYDYIKIHDGSSESAPLLGRFCGKTLPANITSTGNSMYMSFKSDDSVNDWGFKGKYVIRG